MFGPKKPPAPKLPWAIQILTTDYLIDGALPPAEYVNDDNDIFWAAFHGYTQFAGAKLIANKLLTDVRVQPTGNSTAPAQTFARWLVTRATNLVAIIPNDDASRQAAQAACQDYKYGISGLMFAGPYLVRGTFAADSADRVGLGYEWSLLPVHAAQVDSQLPGGKLAGLQVPFLFLNGGMIHGIATS